MAPDIYQGSKRQQTSLALPSKWGEVCIVDAGPQLPISKTDGTEKYTSLRGRVATSSERANGGKEA